MASTRYSRRQLLAAVGASAVFVPLLQACGGGGTASTATSSTAAQLSTVSSARSTSSTRALPATTSAQATTTTTRATAMHSSTVASASQKVGAATTTVSLLAIMNPQLQAWYHKNVFDPYMQQHPNIKIDLIIYLYKDRFTKPETMLAGGTPPDLTAWYQHTFVFKKMLTDVTPLAAAAKLDMKSFYPQAVDYVTVNNKVWGIPYRVNNVVMYINKDLFQQQGISLPPLKWGDPSWTWSRLFEIAKQMTQRQGTTTTTFGLGGVAGYNQFPWFYGEHWLSPDRTHMTIDPNGPGVALIQQVANQFLPIAHTGPIGKEGSGMDLFAQGKAGMFQAGTWVLQNFNPPLNKFNWGLAPLPIGTKPATVYYTDGYSIFTGVKHIDQDWAFLQYLVSPDIQKSTNQRYGAFPSLQALKPWSATQQTTFPPADRALPIDGLQYGVNPSFAQIAQADQVQSIVDGATSKIETGKASAKAAIEAIIPQVNGVLKSS